MRYYYEKPDIVVPLFGINYICDHPVYNRCTLFVIQDIGLAVIQQRYSPLNKHTWWTEIDPDIANQLYLRPGFKKYFDLHAKKPKSGIYPTVTVRQIMWALRMKPLKKEVWETVFDHTRNLQVPL